MIRVRRSEQYFFQPSSIAKDYQVLEEKTDIVQGVQCEEAKI